MHEEKGMTVAAILETKGTEVLTARADQKVSDVLKLLAERRIGAVPVMDGDTVVGVFSERDIIYGLAQDGPPILDRRVDQMMTAPAVTVTRDQTRSEEHTSELQSLMRISYAVFCLKKKKNNKHKQ